MFKDLLIKTVTISVFYFAMIEGHKGAENLAIFLVIFGFLIGLIRVLFVVLITLAPEGQDVDSLKAAFENDNTRFYSWYYRWALLIVMVYFGWTVTALTYLATMFCMAIANKESINMEKPTNVG